MCAQEEGAKQVERGREVEKEREREREREKRVQMQNRGEDGTICILVRVLYRITRIQM